MNQTVSVFQLGSSTVVTLPKKFGFKPGQRLKVEKSGQKVVLKPQKMSEKEIERLVESLSGGLNLKKDLTPDEINRILDEEYEDHKIMLPGR